VLERASRPWENETVRCLRVVLPGVVVLAATIWLYAPALGFELAGDDYQWVQHAHLATHRPVLLLADLDTFYRPASTWTLAFDRLVWGFRPFGFHLTNLLLHGLAGIGLALAGRRLGLPSVIGWTLGLLWALSPFSEEPAASVAIRFEDLLLLAWLGLILAWPRADQRWSRGRRAAVVAFTALALFSKETWVVTPGLVFALEWGYRKTEFRKALRTALPFLALAVVYVTVYFIAFPGGKNYFQGSLRPLLKVSHQLAAFLYLEGLVPVAFSFSAAGAIALAAVTCVLVFAVRRRNAAATLGAALLLFPMLPTLLVPYLPTRYTSIPYAGFLLLISGAAREAAAGIRGRWRHVVSLAASAVVALVLAAGVFTVRADLDDLRRVSRAHGKLIAEARAALPYFPLDCPVVVLRRETENPLQEIITTPLGIPKLYFARQSDPYGLIDAAALFEWVLGREDLAVRRWDDGERRFAARVGAVLVHTAAGFTLSEHREPDIGAFGRRTLAAGVGTRFLTAETLP
jgi:hypothetical protein